MPAGETDENLSGSVAAPSATSIRKALARVLDSPAFLRSPRLSRFLSFVVETALNGNEENLKEYTIGVEVFDRGSSFDPRVETIVRVEARRLRNQLNEYYGGAGREDAVRIEIPKGGYKPAIQTRRHVPSKNHESPAGKPLDPKTVIVLPFEDMSASHDQTCLGDGIAEEITHGLAQVAWLRVISRSSAFSFKGKNIDIREIGQHVGAGTALEGSVRTSQSRVRVTAQLIDAVSGNHLWSERFDRDSGEVFEIQDTVTAAVIKRLETCLGAPPARPEERLRKPTASAPGYDLYLKGRYYMYRYTRADVATAIECFEEAVALDPHYAQPWAGLAESYAITAILGWAPPADVMPRSKQASLRALEIDDTIAEAHASLALVLFRHDYQWDEAGREFQRALDLAPQNANIRFWYSSFLVFVRRPEEAIKEAQHASELDPLSVEAQRVVADTLYFCRRFEDTIEQCDRILSHHASYYFAYFYKGMALVARDRMEEAVDSLNEANRLSSNLPLTRSVLGWALARAGETERARQSLEELTVARGQGYFPAFLIAVISVGLGDKDLAFEWLQRAFVHRDALLPILEVDHIWDPLRSDPRFTILLV